MMNIREFNEAAKEVKKGEIRKIEGWYITGTKTPGSWLRLATVEQYLESEKYEWDEIDEIVAEMAELGCGMTVSMYD